MSDLKAIACTGTRTLDPQIKSLMLYRLSYPGFWRSHNPSQRWFFLINYYYYLFTKTLQVWRRVTRKSFSSGLKKDSQSGKQTSWRNGSASHSRSEGCEIRTAWCREEGEISGVAGSFIKTASVTH